MNETITISGATYLEAGNVVEIYGSDGQRRRKVIAVDGSVITVRELTAWENRWHSLKMASKRFVRRFFPDYDPDSIFDYLRLPWSLARWLFAWAWTQVWYPTCRLHWRVRTYLPRLFLLTRYFLPLGGGRREDPDPVYCPWCLWAGPTRWLIHTYQDDGTGEDVEAVDECPRCGGEV